MKTIAINLFSSILLLSCAAKNISSENRDNILTDKTYGYTEKNPIKVGGGENGPANERKYLNSLTGPNGEKVSYTEMEVVAHFRQKTVPLEKDY